MKVYGGTTMHYHEHDGRRRPQVRAIVAAKSGAEVMRAAGISRSEFNGFWSETGNEREIAAAMAAPGVVLWRSLDDHRGDYRPLVRK